MASKMKEIMWSFVPTFPCCTRKQESQDEKTLNIVVGFSFMVNFVLGTGFLGIPYSFFHGGLIAGACTLVVISIMTWLTALWEVEVMARAQAINDQKQNGDTDINSQMICKSPTKPKFEIVITRKFEPSELCEIFVGRWLKVTYLILMTVHNLLACLSYATVVGSAWSVNIPLNFGSLKKCNGDNFLHQSFPQDSHCGSAYRFCLLLFAIIVIPLSLIDLKEQAIIQFLLGALRYITIGIIIIFCIVHLFPGYVINIDIETVNETLNETNQTLTSLKDISTHFNFDGWIMSIPVFLYAHILHSGIPTLTHPIKEKKWLREYFSLLYATIGTLYMVLGIVGSLCFRDTVNETVTLNWDPLTHSSHSIHLRALSYYIILFPSIDVCSVYPLMVHTIVNNIYTVVFGKDTSQDKGRRLCLIQLSMKFVIALLPIFIALFVSNLVYVLKYAGLAGFSIALFFPIILQLRSQWVCVNRFHYMLDIDSLQSPVQSQSQDNETPSFEIDDLDIQNEKIEKTPLLENKHFNKKLVLFFLFSRDSILYYTPYSTVLSYPVVVIIVCFLSILFLLLSVASLFVQST